MPAARNRRQFERMGLPPMYTFVSLQLDHPEPRTLEGHAYDISEGGVQFELDEPVTPGTPVQITLELPHSFGADGAGDPNPTRVRAFANVVWSDDSEPGPVRLAAVFTRFASLTDEDLLRERLLSARRSRHAA